MKKYIALKSFATNQSADKSKLVINGDYVYGIKLGNETVSRPIINLYSPETREYIGPINFVDIDYLLKEVN